VPFELVRLEIPDVALIKPQRFVDSRGYLAVTYVADDFRRMGIPAAFIQDNEARSTRRGTIRGLHFQRGAAAQAKLVRVLSGAVFDVAVDVRPASPTFGKWVAETLTAEGGEQLFIPRGFAHGYCTVTDDAVVAYKCDNVYAPAAEGGVHFSDPALAITWPIAAADVTLSDKDRALPPLGALDASQLEMSA
jgi:dTDP-4-dehydrorhamnose 3,5-epimerase